MKFEFIEFWPMLAGLGLFLFGMSLLENSIKNLAGRSFKIFLRQQTNHTLKAIFAGALVTAVVQSSAMVTLLVMSFAGAGVIGLKNGVGMILGANLGTTFKGWLFTYLGFNYNIEAVIYPMLAIGGLMGVLFSSSRMLSWSRILVGFSLIFLGLEFIKNGFTDFAANLDLSVIVGKPGILFFIFGIAFTAAIQSSSASMMIFLSSLSAGVISLPQAVYLVIGADLGTTITAIIGASGGNSIRRKVAWSQVIINVVSAILGLMLAPKMIEVLKDLFGNTDKLLLLVSFHSALNLIGIFAMLPFLGWFTKLLDKFISGKTKRFASLLANSNPKEAQSALDALAKETIKYGQSAIISNKEMLGIYVPKKEGVNYADLKEYENEITIFHLKMHLEGLSEQEVDETHNLTAAVRNAVLSAKDIKDVKHNIDEIRQSASKELIELGELIEKGQSNFYDAIEKFIDEVNLLNEPDAEQLKTLNKELNLKLNEKVLELSNVKFFSRVDFSSIFNLINAINNSNEALIRYIEFLIKAKD